MPRYISKMGKFYPCKERVALTNNSGATITVDGKEVKPGDPYIYEGPDRAALFELWKAGVEYLGDDISHDSELLEVVRQKGFKDLTTYLKFYQFDVEKAEAEFQKNASIVTNHEIKEKVHVINKLGGGVDLSGNGKDIMGGFGDHG